LIGQVENLSGRNNDVVSGFEKLNLTINESVEKYKDAIQSSSSFVNDTKKLVEEIRDLSTKLAKTQELINQTAGRSVEESRLIQEIQKRNAELNGEFNKSFTVVEKGLASILDQLGKNMDKYKNLTKEGLETYLKQFDDSLSQATTKLSATVNEFGESLDDLKSNLDVIRNAAEKNKKV